MITDNETNFLYLADTLQTEKPNFYKNLIEVLNNYKINHALIPETKAIWAVDYMPIQIDLNKFVRFVYNPDYLQTEKLKKTISPVDISRTPTT